MTVAATYTITVFNDGRPRDVRPGRSWPTTSRRASPWASLPAGCAAVGHAVRCTIPAGLAAGASASFAIPVTPTVSGVPVTNTATVSGGGDPGCQPQRRHALRAHDLHGRRWAAAPPDEEPGRQPGRERAGQLHDVGPQRGHRARRRPRRSSSTTCPLTFTLGALPGRLRRGPAASPLHDPGRAGRGSHRGLRHPGDADGQRIVLQRGPGRRRRRSGLSAGRTDAL